MKRLLYSSLAVLFLISCESKESKIKRAKEIVQTFITDLSFENFEAAYKLYPSFKNVGEFWRLKKYDIQSATLNEKIITVVVKNDNIEAMFEVQEIDGKYIITKSKGMSSDYDSYLYKYCKNIGCIGISNNDVEISKVCEEKKSEYKALIYKIKEQIESNVIMENHNVKKEYFSVSGNINVKNYSNITIPSSSYDLYVNFTDNNGNVLFTTKEYSFESIPYGQSININVFESNRNSFRKIGIKLKLKETRFIEKIIAEYAKGSNCEYGLNL